MTKLIYPPEVAERFKASVGKSYQPANGTEGEAFWSHYCFQCKHDADPSQGCEILLRTMVFSPSESEYPIEWVYGADGQPVCTAFIERSDD